MWEGRSLGHGIGLRTKHFSHLAENPPTGVDWFEVISENFFEPGGRPWLILDRVRSALPVVMHGVSLGIGNAEAFHPTYLRSLRGLMERLEPAWVSDHLCWGAYGGHQAHDLLPLPHTKEAIDHIVPRILHVQDVLKRRIMLENVSSYVSFQESEMPEWEFLREIVERADCGILLDVNNIYVSAHNHGFSIDDYLEGIPRGRVGQFHLAGHTQKEGYILDSHIGPIIEGVWQVYRKALQRFGPIPTLIEWDEEIPPYDEVVAESHRARQIEAFLLQDLASSLPSRLSKAGPQTPGLSDAPPQASAARSRSQATQQTHAAEFQAAQRTPLPPHLQRVQKHFWDFISAPCGVAAAKEEMALREPGSVPLLGWIASPSEEAATKRLDVYASMYFFRIFDSLAEDYAKIRKAIGENAFHNLITDYLLACPSENPSLRYAGERLPAYLSTHPITLEHPYLPDLARLEWARLDVFDRPFCPLLDLAALQALPPEAWGEMHLRSIPALRLLSLAYPVDHLWLALHQDQEPFTLSPEETSIVVWRHGIASDHARLDTLEAKALQTLLQGSSFGEICALGLPPSDEGDEIPQEAVEAASHEALRWLVSWLQRGFLQALETPVSPL